MWQPNGRDLSSLIQPVQIDLIFFQISTASQEIELCTYVGQTRQPVIENEFSLNFV